MSACFCEAGFLFRLDNKRLKQLGVFEQRMSARTEAFSLLKCLCTTEFLAVGVIHSNYRDDCPRNHNYNKIVKSDWLSTALISTLIGQFNRTVHVMPK